MEPIFTDKQLNNMRSDLIDEDRTGTDKEEGYRDPAAEG